MMQRRGSLSSIDSTSTPYRTPTTYSTPSTWTNRDCNFDVSSGPSGVVYHYDLCPLLSENRVSKKIQVVQDESTPPTYTRHVYEISMLGANGLEWDGTLPSNLQCPKGTWICLTVINTRPDHPSEPSRILQVIPIATIEDIKPKTKYISNTQLQVAFHGGRYTGKKHKALFQFSCDRNVESTFPELLWSFNGTHNFSWASKYACSTISPISTLPPSPTTPSNSDPEPSDSPPQESEDPELPYDAPNNDKNSLMFASISIALFLLLWRILPRGRVPGRIFLYSKVSHVLRTTRPSSFHQSSISSGNAHEDSIIRSSISLEDLSEEGNHERVLLSPKETTFPKYGL